MTKITCLVTRLLPFFLLAGCLESEKEETDRAGLAGYVALGTSLSAGFQSSGMRSDWQRNSFPALLAEQMGIAGFALPIIDTPGLGSQKGTPSIPLFIDPITRSPTTRPLGKNPQGLLANSSWHKPYHNLGIPGAATRDMLLAYDALTAQDVGNSFFNIILRPTLFNNTTMLRQAVMLKPTLITLEMGSNDILGGVTAGTLIPGTTATPISAYTALMDRILDTLLRQTDAHIFLGNLPAITSIPFVTTVPLYVFDPATFEVDTSKPLETVESDVRYVLLPALQAIAAGMGMPGANKPLAGKLTLTAAEVAVADSLVAGYNVYLKAKADGNPRISLVDLHELLMRVRNGAVSGVSGKYYLLDPLRTAFSLDGIHPNNKGYRLMANAFLERINVDLGKNHPLLSVD